MDLWLFFSVLAVYCIAAGATLTAFYAYLAKQNGAEGSDILIAAVVVGLLWPVTAPMILGAWLMFKFVNKYMKE